MSEIERLFSGYVRGRLSRRSLVLRLLALGVSPHFVETALRVRRPRALAAAPQPLPAKSPRVVLVVLDAFRADYASLAPMPNLTRLMESGVSYRNAWVGQLESMTPASHATISTGASPARHGIIGFSWRDDKTQQEVYGAWYDDVLAGRLEQQLQQHHVNSIPRAVKRVDPTARVVSLSSEKYYAADAMGGPWADHIFFGQPGNGVITPQGIPHHVPPETFLHQKSLTRKWPLKITEYDELATTMALASLAAFDPRVLMVNMPGGDTYGHRVGGPATPEVMATIVAGADAQLGRLIKAYRDRNILKDTIFVIAGDHGMVPNTRQMMDTVVKDAVRAAGGDPLFQTGGNAAYIWLRNSTTAATVAQHLADTIPYAVRAHYLTLQSGTYAYTSVKPATMPDDPALDTAYAYMLGTFAGPIAPDVVLTLQENTLIRNRADVKGSPVHGNHSGPTWGVQHVPLVIAGPGIKAGQTLDFPARLMDVAPTVLTLLGITPQGMDGVVLADALARPTKAQVHAQDSLAPSLTAFQKAVLQRSQSDLATTGTG